MAVNLDELTRSLEKTDALKRLNDVFYTGALATNGFDSLGHYLRTVLITNVCSSYAVAPSSGCASTFYDPSAEGSAASDEASLQAAARAGHPSASGGSVAPTGTLLRDLLGQGGDPSVDRRREQNLDALRKRSARGVAGARPAGRGARLPPGE